MTEDFESQLLAKIDSGEELDDQELSELLGFEKCSQVINSRRWHNDSQSLIVLHNRFFILYWSSGLTEHQDNEFCEQPIEVTYPVHRQITRTLTDWYDKNDNHVCSFDD